MATDAAFIAMIEGLTHGKPWCFSLHGGAPECIYTHEFASEYVKFCSLRERYSGLLANFAINGRRHYIYIITGIRYHFPPMQAYL